MIRVAFATRATDETGGAEESLALLVRHLPPDFERHAILFGEGRYAARLRSYGTNVHVVPVAADLLETTRERPSIGGAMALPRSISAVGRLLRRERIDVVHTNTVKAHLVVIPAARTSGVGSVMHVRDIVEGVGRTMVRGLGRIAGGRIAISSAVAAWYRMPNTHVIPNPVELAAYEVMPDRADARARLGIGGTEPVVAIVGRINRWKQHDMFLRIVARVARTRPLQCAIVGEARFRDADFVPELHALAESLGIRDRTHFVPWQDDVRLIYAATDVLCNCSVREPFGRTIVEAAAAGVPSVAFDDGGAPDIIEDGRTGFLVPAGDEAAFANALVALLDPDRRAAFASAARSSAHRFGAEEHAQSVATFLRACSAARKQ